MAEVEALLAPGRSMRISGMVRGHILYLSEGAKRITGACLLMGFGHGRHSTGT